MQGTASDYANMIWGALRLLQATNEGVFLTAAERWCATLDKHFWVADGGGYAFTADDTPDVIVRMRGAHDDATPNANAVMITNLVALGLLTGKPAYLERAEAIPQAFAADLGKNTLGHCGLLAGFYDLLAPQQVVVIETGRRGSRRPSSPAGHVQAVPARRRAAGRCRDRIRPCRLLHRRPPRRQDRHDGQAHRLRLPRPAMLAAGDGAGRAARGAAGQRTAPAA